MKKTFIKVLAMSAVTLSFLSVSACDSNSSNSSLSTVSKANVVYSIQHGTMIFSSNVNDDGLVDVGETVTVDVAIDQGYQLDSLMVNNSDITESKSFKVESASIYNVTAFVSKVNEIVVGETLIEMTAPNIVSIGEEASVETIVYGPSVDVTYTSSNPDILSIDENGKIKGLKAGVSVITASQKDKNGVEVNDRGLVFVAPTYFNDLVTSFTSIDYQKGVNFNLPIDINLGNMLPVTLSSDIKAQYLNNKLNIFGESVVSMMSMPLLNLDYYMLEDLNYQPSLVISKVINDVQTPISYMKADFSLDIGEMIFSFGPTLLAIINGIDIGDMFADTIDLVTVGNMLNTLLTFSENAEEGISLNQAGLTLINTYYSSLLESIEEPTLTAFLPSSISELRFSLSYDEDNNYQNSELVIGGNFTNYDGTVASSDFVNIKLDASEHEILAEDLTSKTESIKNIETKMIDVENHFALINELSVLKQDKQAKEHAYYQERVTELWEKYEAYDDVTKGLITGYNLELLSYITISSFDHQADEFLPWLDLKMLKDGVEVSEVQAGDTIVFAGDVKGYQGENVNFSVNLVLSDSEKDESEYFTYDESTKTLNILKNEEGLSIIGYIYTDDLSSGLSVEGGPFEIAL